MPRICVRISLAVLTALAALAATPQQSADHALSVQASDAISMYAQFEYRLSSGARNARGPF